MGTELPFSSAAMPSEPTSQASVGSVCTHPDYRERGLATRLVEDALRICEQKEVALMLISGGRGLYRRQGCTDVGEMFKTVLTRQDIKSSAHDSLSQSAG